MAKESKERGDLFGGLAQLVERCFCTANVMGSNPIFSNFCHSLMRRKDKEGGTHQRTIFEESSLFSKSYLRRYEKSSLREETWWTLFDD
jgi:hypothetical protein